MDIYLTKRSQNGEKFMYIGTNQMYNELFVYRLYFHSILNFCDLQTKRYHFEPLFMGFKINFSLSIRIEFILDKQPRNK